MADDINGTLYIADKCVWVTVVDNDLRLLSIIITQAVRVLVEIISCENIGKVYMLYIKYWIMNEVDVIHV